MTDPDEVPLSGHASPGDAPPPASGQSPLPLPVAPRAHPATTAPRREKAPDGSKISLEELVSWLGQADQDDGAPGEEAPVEETHQSRESRKFRRTESAAAKAVRAAGVTEEPPLDERPSPRNGSARHGEGAIIPELTPRGARLNPRAPSLFSSLAAQCVILGLMVSCYALGRMTLAGRVPAAAQTGAATAGGKESRPAHGIPEPVMGVLDQALTAQSAGDPEKAFNLLEQVRSGGEHVNGLDFELGWLAYRRGDYPTALVALNRSIADGEEVGAAYDLRGLIAGQQRPGLGGDDFESATQERPFDAIAFFHWGEALRRNGKPRQALVHLQQALARAQSPAAQSLYGLKIRLTQIELGEEKDFAPALAAALARPQLVPEWLLTAAAQEMHAGNYAAAAAHLESVRQIGGPAALGLSLQDYFFQGYAEKPGLAAIYAQTVGRPGPAATPAAFPAVALPSPVAVQDLNRGPR
jgi:Tfp pilus assembly protein PilF